MRGTKLTYASIELNREIKPLMPPYCSSKFLEHYPLHQHYVLGGPSTLELQECEGESVQPRKVTVLTDVPPSLGYFGVDCCWKCHGSVILPPSFSLLVLECVCKLTI